MLLLPGLTVSFVPLVKGTNICGVYLGNYISVGVQVTKCIARKAVNRSGQRIRRKRTRKPRLCA